MNNEQARALVERQARAWEQAELKAIVADFAADGVLISPGGKWQGHEALQHAAESFFASATDIQIVVTRVLIDSAGHGAAEWTWSETSKTTGKRHTAEDAIIFVLRDDKIIYWREYFDTAQMQS